MVMEEPPSPPSPDSVGREFVRQYYTLLNKAPVHLHRFYNNSSSFVHGGLDASDRDAEPVVGQKEIHNRIQQLNFRDCHAKITQVDSQATLDNGVVVQVTGELSNGGQPMRRFTQTFVLASQSPRQYYVHNDIFRYQDFVFSDDDADWGYSRGEEPAPQQPPPAALPTPYFPPPPPAPPVVSSHQEHNGHREEPDRSVSESQDTPDREPEPEPQQPAQPEPVPAPSVGSEPKTYANLVKSGQTGAHQTTAARVSAGALRSETVACPQPTVTSAPPPNQNRPRPGRPPRTDSATGEVSPAESPERYDPLSLSDSGAAPNPGGGRPTSGPGRRYSDGQQLFLGNLPQAATKEQLKALFTKFGNVVDVRVYNKQTPGAPGAGVSDGKTLPNYAFLTFEDVESAQRCLGHGQLYYPSADGGDSIPLNVQEKKVKTAGGGNGGGGRGGSNGGPRVPRNNPGFNRRPYQPRR